MANIYRTQRDGDNRARTLASTKRLLRCPKFHELWSTKSFYQSSLFRFVPVHRTPSMRHYRGAPQQLQIKRHWFRLQLRFETPNAIASCGLKWQYIVIIAAFSSSFLFALWSPSSLNRTQPYQAIWPEVSAIWKCMSEMWGIPNCS